MSGQKYEMFTSAKACIRNHPDWDDEQVREFIGAKIPEMELIREARKDYEADRQPPVRFS